MDAQTYLRAIGRDHRVLLILAKDSASPFLRAQHRIIEAAEDGFRARDFVVQDWTAENIVRHPDTDLHAAFAVRPEDFTILLIGKDGHEAARFTAPVSAETIFRLVDAMPMRQREMRDARMRRASALQ